MSTREHEIETRLEKADTDNWAVYNEHELLEGSVPAWCVTKEDNNGKFLYDVSNVPQGEGDREIAEFIAHSPEDIRYLLDRVANQERHIALLRSLVDNPPQVQYVVTTSNSINL